MAIFFDVVSFNPEVIYNVIGIIAVLLTGAGFILDLKSKLQLLKNDLKNTNDNLEKLEKKTLADYARIEAKMNNLEQKIEDLPVNITNLIKNFLSK